MSRQLADKSYRGTKRYGGRRGPAVNGSKVVLTAMMALLLAILAIAPGCGAGRVSMTAIPSARPSGPKFTSKVRIVPGLAEPLVTTKPTNDAEDRDLSEATQGRDGAIPPLEAFLAAHPDSGWNAAIHTDLGLAHYRQGFFSKAFAAYEAAWKEGRDATDVRARRLVDRAVAELARMHARVGHLAELDALLADIGSRPIQGGPSELLTGAKEGAWTMRHNPGASFLCGPKALKNVLWTLHAPPSSIAVADAARSGEHGFTLAQLSNLADQAGLSHRLIRRKPGEPVPVPSVINWRVSHYAAIVGRTDCGSYQVKDPTFGDELEVSEAAIDEEGSGYFLVPAQADAQSADDERLAWRDATADEAHTVYGMGWPNGFPMGHVSSCDPTVADAISNGATGDLGAGQCNAPTDPSCPLGQMCVPSARAAEVSLTISDNPVGYAPPLGPRAYIRLVYNQREATEPYGPPGNPVSFNVGPQWTINVLSYVLDNPASPGAGVSRYLPGGGAVYPYTGYGALTPGAFEPEPLSGAILSRTPTTGMATSYTLTNADGSQLVYLQNDGSGNASTYRRMFLSQIIDPKGKALTLNYDTSLSTANADFEGADSGFDAGTASFFPRLTTITDPAGTAVMTFSYGLPAMPLLVTQITDAFGRHTSLQYYPSGNLWQITDILGITSQVTYNDPKNPNFVSQLTTPYGITTFAYDEMNVPKTAAQVITRWLETTDPLGNTERVEFAEGGGSPGLVDYIPASNETGSQLPLPAGMPLSLSSAVSLLQYRNLFFWNKHIYPTARSNATPGMPATTTGMDYTQAELVHFLHTSDMTSVGATIESVRHPLENRIWYQYAPSQTSSIYEGNPATYLAAPTTVARVEDDGSTQLTSVTRNPLGKPTIVIDPILRQTQLKYDPANNIDLLSVQQKASATTVATLASYTYNSYHEPLTYTDASGQITHFAYDPVSRQLTRRTDARGNAIVYAYDGAGRLGVAPARTNRSGLGDRGLGGACLRAELAG